MSKEVDGVAKRVWSSALLVGAVSTILVAGFVLRADPRDKPSGSAAAATFPDPTLALGSTIALATDAPASALGAKVADQVVPAPTAAPPETPADPNLVKLATRAERDRERLATARGRWTAQIVVACRPETVDRLLKDNGAATKLYVIAARVKDDSCFRVCFGAYKTSKDAAAATDLPKALRSKDRVVAVEIQKVLL